MTTTTATTTTTTAAAAAAISSDPFGGFVVATQDGYKLYAKVWPATTAPPVAVVVLVHGFGEHVNRYNHVARAFAAAGIKVVGFDQRGHGRTPGLRGEMGTMAETMTDIELILQLHYERSVPLFLFGHSMGGMNVLSFITQRKPEVEMEYPVAGVIASGPALTMGSATTATASLQYVLLLAASYVPVINTATVDVPMDLTTLTRDADERAAYLSDPLVHHAVSLRSARDLVSGGPHLLAEGYRHFTKPLLIAHGTADQIAQPQAACAFFDKVAVTDKTLRLFNGYYHELHNEPERDDVIQTYITWILQRSGSKARL